MTEQKDLIVVEQLNPVQIFTGGGADPLVEKIKKLAEEFEPDLTTEGGRKEIASLAYKIARSKTTLDEMGKSLVADQKAQIKKVDAERRRVWDELEGIQASVRAPLTEWENAEKNRIAQCKELIEGFEIIARNCEAGWNTLSIDEMKGGISDIESCEQNHDVDWKEFKFKADTVRAESIKTIKESIAKREKYDAEQAELARLRKEQEERERKEREDRIAKEAAERAKKEAEEVAEKLRKQAEDAAKAQRERIEREKAEADEARKKAEKAQKEAEAKAKVAREEAEERMRAKAEADKKAEADAIAKREANKRHKAKIHREIRDELTSGNVNQDDAEQIVKAIANGLIPHLTINY
jgi:hypothetical protein